MQFDNKKCEKRDSSVGIATRYKLEGPVIEYGWGQVFRSLLYADPGVDPVSCKIGKGEKQSGRGVDPSTLSSNKIKERVELHLYSPCTRSWHATG
jgi:hypothetical protein